MTKPKIIQVCFSLKTGITLEELKHKLTNLKETLTKQYGEHDFEIRSCHLNRQICKDKGFTPEIPNLFENIFGSSYVCELTETTFDEAMKNMNKHREELSKKADRLVLLSNETITNVALELKLFTDNRVIIL